jgi:hypothetical protein
MMKNLGFILLLLSISFISCDSQPEKAKEGEPKVIEDTSEFDYLRIGQEISSEAQKVLGSNLMQAINQGGTEHAISFCNVNAIRLTDSTALALNATIRRVTDLPRNPKNKGNQKELDYIQKLKAKAEDYQPMIKEMDDKMVAYYPIVTNALCIKCHGTEKIDIDPKTLAKIDVLYPSDKARNYEANQLRGLWVVEMDKK